MNLPADLLEPMPLLPTRPDALPHKASAPKSRALAAGMSIRCLAVLLGAALLGGCGSPGTPQPPSLKLPSPPADLVASRAGDLVTLGWTMPRRATDRVPLAGDQRVVLCRGVGSSPCSAIGVLLLQPGAPAAYTDALPADLHTGAPRLLTYTVLLENHKQRGAGPSNPAYTAAGAAPPQVDHLHAEATASGIVLHWQPALSNTVEGSQSPSGAQYVLRLQRTLVPGPSQGQAIRTGEALPAEQALEVPEGSGHGETLAAGWKLDHATDQDAALNQTYRYTVARVARLTLQGHPLSLGSAPSAPAAVNARDVFPPGVPQGLEAVGDSDGGTIDLSWTADGEPDLAGYFVYRRPAGSNLPPLRISDGGAVANAAWRDASARRGVRYAYSVSAVDTSGNESARSAEVAEILDEVPLTDQRQAKTPPGAVRAPPVKSPHRR